MPNCTMRTAPHPPIAEDDIVGAPSPASVRLPRHEIDMIRHELRDTSGAHVELRPRSFAVLRLFALSPGKLVRKDQIMDHVWDDAAVTEDSLTQCIADIRRAIGDTDRAILRTIPRRGYLLTVEPDLAVIPDTAVSPRRRLGWPYVAAFMLALALLFLALRPDQPPRELPPLAPDRPSLAVMMFKAGIPDPKADLLAAGIATAIINELARNRDLRVIARDSSFALSGRTLAPHDIGAQLRVRYLVDGTAQRIGDRLTVAIQLIDTRDNTVAWADTFSASTDDIGAMQPAIVNRITTSLHSGMRESGKQAILGRAPRDLDVYERTLRGLALKHQFSVEATRQGRADLEAAIARDPNYAPAWSILGWLNITDILNQFSGEWGMARIDEVIGQFNRAIQLDPNLPLAYQGLSRTITFKGDLHEAHRLIRRALELGPSDADNWLFLGTVLHQMGDAAGAVRAAEQALDLNPIRPSYYARHYGEILWGAARYAHALEQSEDCLRKAPQFTHCEIFRILALMRLGRAEAARTRYRDAVARFANFETSVRAIIPKPPALATLYQADLRAAAAP